MAASYSFLLQVVVFMVNMEKKVELRKVKLNHLQGMQGQK